MRKKLLRFSVCAMAFSAATAKASAIEAGCPGNIVIGGTMACHTGSSNCASCVYSCDDGKSYTWNMCGQET